MAKEKSKTKDSGKPNKKPKSKSLKKPVKSAKTKKDSAKIKSAPSSKKQEINISKEERIEMIRTAAYYLAQKRGHDGNYELDDWIEAENKIDAATDYD